jgi:metal-sulfur cluster biosynthetic enzyme
MGAQIAADVQSKLLALDEIEEANVELVWDPPWTKEMMTETAQLQLGFL